MYCDQRSQYIQVRKLFKGGNYSRKYGIYWKKFIQKVESCCLQGFAGLVGLPAMNRYIFRLDFNFTLSLLKTTFMYFWQWSFIILLILIQVFGCPAEITNIKTSILLFLGARERCSLSKKSKTMAKPWR